MPDMDWDRILSTLRKGREQLESLRIGSDDRKTQADDELTEAPVGPEEPQDHDS